MGDGIVLWKSKKQTSVALSSVEAEYMAMCQAAKEAVWFIGLLQGISIGLCTPFTLYSDNQGVLALAQNPMFHRHSKHIDMQYHYMWELVQVNRIVVKYIPTDIMLADSLTNSLA
jgi:hypothetical protein